MFKTLNMNKMSGMVKLAAMECLSSCVVTSLKLSGINHHLFLLDYWKLKYINGNLLPGKEVHEYRLDQTFGLQSGYNAEGNKHDLINLFASGGVAFFNCSAGKLTYFPKNYLTHESSGFDHCMILYDYNEERDTIRVIDPSADYVGELSMQELYDASIVPGTLTYYTLMLNNNPEAHCTDDIVREAAETNWTSFLKGTSFSGIKAWRRFCTDLDESLTWDKTKREVWIGQNNITITSMIKMRQYVWSSYKELNLFHSDDVAQGEDLIKEIVQNWTTLNFLLLKYSRSQQAELIHLIRKRIGILIRSELTFLKHIRQIARLKLAGW